MSAIKTAWVIWLAFFTVAIAAVGQVDFAPTFSGGEHRLEVRLTPDALPVDDARRLATIPGVGVMTATALIAAIGKAETFERGRDLAAWLGLVPRQWTTGGKPRLMGLSKRGNKYLRKLLIHGARAALPHVAARNTPLGRWTKGLLARVHPNVAVVALANKLARIACAVLRHGQHFAAKEAPMAT